MSAASTMGCALERWQHGMTVMLEQVVGNIKVDKLWAILFMEADFNFVNKLMCGSLLIRSATDNNCLQQKL